MAELRFLAAGFLGHQFRMRLHVRQHLGAERQIAAQVVQKYSVVAASLDA